MILVLKNHTDNIRTMTTEISTYQGYEQYIPFMTDLKNLTLKSLSLLSQLYKFFRIYSELKDRSWRQTDPCYAAHITTKSRLINPRRTMWKVRPMHTES